MTRKWIVMLCITVLQQSAWACDFCNCYFGINPYSTNSNIGIRYHYSMYSGTHHSASELSNMNVSASDFTESRTVTELHGRWFPVRKLRLDYSIPYVSNKFYSPEVTTSAIIPHGHTSHEGAATVTHSDKDINGIGDPLLLLQYQLLFKGEDDTSEYRQQLFVGAGIKMPLGDATPDELLDEDAYAHLSGSGSWDYLVNVTYSVKHNKTGINANLNYMVTSASKHKFEFGNKANVNVTGFYECKTGNSFLYPSIGVFYEHAEHDRFQSVEMKASGGDIVYAHAGADYFYKKFAVSAAFEYPALLSIYKPQPGIQYRIITGVAYSF